MKTYTKHHCFFCGKTISSNGLAKASHYRKHVREGRAEEVFTVGEELYFKPIKVKMKVQEMLETITMLKSENYAYKSVRTKAQHSIEENENQIKNLLQKIKEENGKI